MLEQIISLIAPHQCLHCPAEGILLCAKAQRMLAPPPQKCCLCGGTTTSSLLCAECQQTTPLDYINAATRYESYGKQLVAKLKFGQARDASTPMATIMARYIVPATSESIIMHVPTASVRIRSRGYDQAVLLAKQISKHTNLPRASLLLRSGKQRQVGQSRAARKQQLSEVFHIARPGSCLGMNFLLIDDVVTTGSTLEAAAVALKQAGAKRVGALVFAAA